MVQMVLINNNNPSRFLLYYTYAHVCSFNSHVTVSLSSLLLVCVCVYNRYLVGRQLVNYGISPTELFLEKIEDSEPVQESGEH